MYKGEIGHQHIYGEPEALSFRIEVENARLWRKENLTARGKQMTEQQRWACRETTKEDIMHSLQVIHVGLFQ